MREFITKRDLPELNKWLAAHEMPELWADDIPPVGFIVDDVACGFLCNTDCSTCFIEGFVSNPLAPMRARNSAIWDIAYAVLNVAKESGYKRCLLLSNNSAILSRGKILGFEFFDTKVMAKVL